MLPRNSGYDPDGHRRRSIRLRGFDYTRQGAYFVTICAKDRECLFGEVADGKMLLNAFGEVVLKEWLKTAEIRPYVILYPEELIVMPNHVPGIIWISPRSERAQHRCAPTPTDPTDVAGGSLGAIILSYKSVVTLRLNQMRATPGAPIWQRNYYEHIIRDAASLDEIRQYIQTNPARWSEGAAPLRPYEITNIW